MIDSRTAPWGALLMRVVLAGLFFAHLALKFFVFTPAGTAQFFEAHGVPGFMAYITMVWELLGATVLLLGIWPRLVALAMVPVLLGAIVSVHGAAGFFFKSQVGGWEYPAFWIVALIGYALTDDGKFVLKPTPTLLR